MNSSDKKRQIGKYVPAVVFLIFIFGLAVWFVFAPKSDYSSFEKRYLQKFPEANAENIANGEFGEDFEKFFADRFPARIFWVGMNAYCKLWTGNNGADGVYNCGNGYLINVPVSADNRLDTNVQTIVSFSKSVDVPVTVMFAPSSGYVADDVLPAVHNSYNDDGMFEAAAQTFSQNSIGFADLRQAFKNSYAGGNQLYYKTDHHWTTKGAYIAYTELCRQLDITPTAQECFEIEQYGDFYGTTYSTSGFWLTAPDTLEVWKNKSDCEENITVRIIEGNEESEYHSMFFYSHLDEDDKYPVFLDGNHAITEITNSGSDGGTLVIIKDSFSHSLAPFLADNYSRLILVDMRYYKQSVSQLIEDENADGVVVLYGIDNIATDTDLVWLQ